jgi:Type II secretion system (T2SS), protein G
MILSRHSQRTEARQKASGSTRPSIVIALAVTVMALFLIYNLYEQRSYKTALSRRANEQQEDAYCLAVKNFVRDCGVESLRTNKLPDVLFRNVGISNWNGPYLDGMENAPDVFGRQFKFESNDKSFRITSAGEDGKFETSDDVMKSMILNE